MTTVNLDIVLKRLLTQNITLRKWTEVERSGTFGTVEKTPDDYVIKGAVFTNPLEYSYWASLGDLDVGQARGFFFNAYELDTGLPPHGVAEPEDLIVVEEEDWIIDENGIEWEILRINKYKEWNYTIVVVDLNRRTTE